MMDTVTLWPPRLFAAHDEPERRRDQNVCWKVDIQSYCRSSKLEHFRFLNLIRQGVRRSLCPVFKSFESSKKIKLDDNFNKNNCL